MPDLTTLPIDALTVTPDGTVWARNERALRVLPDGTVIRDPLIGAVGELGTHRGERVIHWTGGPGNSPISAVLGDPDFGVEVIAGPRKRRPR